MGWLEVFALLKRVVPLLSRIAPMLESFLAARSGAREDTEAALERLAGDVKGQLAATTQKHEGVAELLKTQAAQIASLAEGLRKLHAADDRNAARLLEIETAVGTLSQTLRKVAALLVILLVACLCLLIALLRHHSA